MQQNNLLRLGMFLIVIFLSFAIFLQWMALENTKKQECIKLDMDLKYEEGGNCCFVDDNEAGLLPRYRAVPCDNLDYVPEKKISQRDNFGQAILSNWNVTEENGVISFN